MTFGVRGGDGNPPTEKQENDLNENSQEQFNEKTNSSVGCAGENSPFEKKTSKMRRNRSQRNLSKEIQGTISNSKNSESSKSPIGLSSKRGRHLSHSSKGSMG